MSLKRKILILTAFAIAMGFLETAVVVYMREILYPGGFKFPLSPISPDLAITELLREVATLVMLVTVGALASRRFSTGFAWFIYCFAIWDIFYYVFLKLILGWPDSLMTWDVLFLIPTTWTGPVITPVIVSMTMILLAMIILVHADRGKASRILGREWIWLISGSLILIFGWIFDYSSYMLGYFSVNGMMQVKNPEVLRIATGYIPGSFPWWIFLVAEGVILTGIGLFWRRVSR